MTVTIRTRSDALVWKAVDAIFNGGDAKAICAQLELDLYGGWADAILEREERHDRLLRLLRETDPRRLEDLADGDWHRSLRVVQGGAA